MGPARTVSDKVTRDATKSKKLRNIQSWIFRFQKSDIANIGDFPYVSNPFKTYGKSPMFAISLLIPLLCKSDIANIGDFPYVLDHF